MPGKRKLCFRSATFLAFYRLVSGGERLIPRLLLDIRKLEHACVLFVMTLVPIMKDPVEELAYLGSVMRMLSKANASARGKISILTGVTTLFH